MKGKTFLILLVAAGVLVAFSLLRSGDEKSTGEVRMGDKLFADLPVNEVATVTVTDAENQVTLTMGDKRWQVKERNGYAADFDEIRDTVVKLSRLKIGRSFAATPESLTRLSLNPPSVSADTGKGSRITLADGSGKIVADVILGQTRETEDGASGGQYLKKAEADTILLVDGNFQFLKTAPAQWLKTEILNIKADDVAAVTCYADDPSTPVYILSRPQKGQAADMQPVPKGRTADTVKIEQVIEALAPLTIEDVQAADSGNPPAEAGRTRLVYRLYDGRQITLFPAHDDKENYTLRVTAEEIPVDEKQVDTPEPGAEDKDAPKDKVPAKTDTAALPTPTVQQLNQELGPWVFSIKKWQYDSFITDPAALLEEVKQAE